MDATRTSWMRWLLTAWLGGTSAIIAEGLTSSPFGWLSPDLLLSEEPRMHGGERVGTLLGVAVILGLCFVGARRAIQSGVSSPFWASIAVAEVLRWAATPVVLGAFVFHPLLRVGLPASSLAVFARSALLWWPVLLLASGVSAGVQLRRIPAPRGSRAVGCVVGAAVAVLLFLAFSERSTPTLYYSRMLWSLFKRT
ncbi:hypothetical protein [Corallococcus exercitus]|uniref:Uncharacterized protein n=1 Tax=Corallococcus exercitus TaxID=2316736 RepID=A0A7Y4NH22_9BACT|nr:hypothetical protein [Corallococcus exercitus]NOK13614.1 hypothetical protein [Corallococcus exercitus]